MNNEWHGHVASSGSKPYLEFITKTMILVYVYRISAWTTQTKIFIAFAGLSRFHGSQSVFISFYWIVRKTSKAANIFILSIKSSKGNQISSSRATLPPFRRRCDSSSSHIHQMRCARHEWSCGKRTDDGRYRTMCYRRKCYPFFF